MAYDVLNDGSRNAGVFHKARGAVDRAISECGKGDIRATRGADLFSLNA